MHLRSGQETGDRGQDNKGCRALGVPPKESKKTSRIPNVIIDSGYTLTAAFAIIGIAILVADSNVNGSI